MFRLFTQKAMGYTLGAIFNIENWQGGPTAQAELNWIRPLNFCDVVLVQYDNLHAPVKGAAVGRAVGLCGRVLTV